MVQWVSDSRVAQIGITVWQVALFEMDTSRQMGSAAMNRHCEGRGCERPRDHSVSAQDVRAVVPPR